MNRMIASILLATSAALSGNAFAEGPMPEPSTFVSTADRAQVQAQVPRGRGGANPWSITYNPLARFESALTRDEVRAAYIEARDEVAALTGEDSGSLALSRQPQAATTEVASLSDEQASGVAR